MLSKSRMIAAMEHREPDRVPIGEQGVDWEITDRALGVETLYRAKWREYTAMWDGRRDEVVDDYVQHIIGLARHFAWDYVAVPVVPARRSSYPRPEMLGEYEWRDEKGLVWHYSPDSGGHAMTKVYPPMTIADLPDPEAVAPLQDSQFEAIERVTKEIGKTHMVIARVPDGTFPWQETIGLENFLERTLTDPDFIRKLIAVSTARSISAIKTVAAIGVDAVMIMTDYCDARGPLMGPRLFREFHLPALKASVEAAHSAGVHLIKHSDGDQWPILDHFVEAGVDGWHGIQPRIGMDLRLLKEQYGDKLTFFGGVNCETLTGGTAEEVAEEVKYAIRYAGPGGGLVIGSGNSLMPGTKYENYLALVETCRQYGAYPIGAW